MRLIEECQQSRCHNHRLSRWVSMLNVMNPSEVLSHHTRHAQSNTFRLSLDGATSISRLSLSLTVVMGQYAKCDEPIKGLAKMVHLKDFVDGQRRYLALFDREGDLPKSGTYLAVRPSLLHPSSRAESLVNSQNFRKNMSIVVKSNNMDAYVLQNTMPDKDATNDKPPLLGRSIVSGAIKWKSNTVKDILELCSVHNAVYASLYYYDRDTNLLRAFCKSWCPTTNTLHTMAGELSISLWDLYKLGSFPISSQIYDEAVPDIHTLHAHTEKGNRNISKACESLIAAYR
ncbi:Serine/threonine-protein phosphatase 7 long form-like protein [Bienertia sinuspersici]